MLGSNHRVSASTADTINLANFDTFWRKEQEETKDWVSRLASCSFFLADAVTALYVVQGRRVSLIHHRVSRVGMAQCV